MYLPPNCSIYKEQKLEIPKCNNMEIILKFRSWVKLLSYVPSLHVIIWKFKTGVTPTTLLLLLLGFLILNEVFYPWVLLFLLYCPCVLELCLSAGRYETVHWARERARERARCRASFWFPWRPRTATEHGERGVRPDSTSEHQNFTFNFSATCSGRYRSSESRQNHRLGKLVSEQLILCCEKTS